MKKIFGNIPAVPFAIILILSILGIVLFYGSQLTGYSFNPPVAQDTCTPAGEGRRCAIACAHSIEALDKWHVCASGKVCCKPLCFDSDIANNLTVKGTCTSGAISTNDSCSDTTHVIERACSGDNLCFSLSPAYCGPGKQCVDGACIYSGPPVQCSGNLHFGLNQTSANTNSKIGFLTNVTSVAPTHPQCTGRTVNIKDGSCSNPTISSCNLGSEKQYWLGTTIYFHECNGTFIASSTAGSHNYFACIDMNLNKVYESNEQLKAVLTTIAPQGCSDPDGNNVSIKGTCTSGAISANDSCFNTTHITERVCSGNNCVSFIAYCGAGKICSDGACISNITGNASVILNSPANNTNITVPKNITFKWVAKNFTSSKLLCVPYAWTADQTGQIYPEDYINCTDGNTCKWAFQINDSHIGQWQWLVGCSVNETDFDDENWTNVTKSEIRNFGIKESGLNETPPACAPDWEESGWQPEPCADGEIQREDYTDINNCGITPEITCTLWHPGNSSCVLERYCGGAPSEIIQITDWKPYPCMYEQWAIFQMQNGTTINQTRSCCTEDWTSKWSECENGTRTEIYEDANLCDTTYKKPAESEPQSCSFLKSLKFYIIAGVSALALILTIILFAKRARRNRRILRARPEEQKSTGVGVKKYPELESYIKKAFIKGLSKIQIRKQLLDAGWPKSAVDDALSA